MLTSKKESIYWHSKSRQSSAKVFNAVGCMVYKAEGLKGLEDRPGRGAQRCLDLEEEEEFKLDVLKLQKDRVGGRVKGKDVLKLMKKKYGLNPSLATVYNTLKRVKLSWITGRSIHPKADLKAQEAFKKTSKKTSLSAYLLG